MRIEMAFFLNGVRVNRIVFADRVVAPGFWCEINFPPGDMAPGGIAPSDDLRASYRVLADDEPVTP